MTARWVQVKPHKRGPWVSVLLALSFALALAVSQQPTANAAEPPMSPHRQAMQHYAYEVGGITLVAILWQESTMCLHKSGDDGTSLGCGQLKLKTARMYAPYVTRPMLLHDDELNIRIAHRHFLYCEALTGSWTGAVYCYNHGDIAARAATWRVLLKDGYVKSIQTWIRRVKPWVYTLRWVP